MGTLIEDNAVVLLQGDSVTDCGRSRDNDSNMGNGYAMMINALFQSQFPEKKVKFMNRGINGNRVKDLQARWQSDCIDLRPSWVSILIGINDCWRRYDSFDPTSLEKFQSGYYDLLKQIKTWLNARIILCEPFVLPVPEDRKQWREDLDPKIHVIRELAREFDALYVPLDGIFAQASTLREPDFWAPDGVHPSSAGHALIARSWLQAVKAI